MDSNCIKIIHLFIDAIIPIVASVIGAIILVRCGRSEVKKIANTRLDNIEKQLREHIRGYSDKEQAEMTKFINEAFSNPSMRNYR